MVGINVTLELQGLIFSLEVGDLAFPGHIHYHDHLNRLQMLDFYEN